MDGKFTRKARFVASGHATGPPASITNYGVVYRYSIGVAFTISDINDIDIWACDIGNAYLTEKFREKIWTKSGTKFGNEK